jgi:hypothetical protein
MRRMPARVLALTALAALVLAGAGCGGGSKKSSSTTTVTKASTTTTAGNTATTKKTATTAKAATTSSDLSAIASVANCRQLADLGTKFSSAVSGAGNSGDMKKVAQLLQEFAAKTPSEIRPDFQVVADNYGKIAEAVGTMKPGATPDAATLAKLQKLATQIDSVKLQKASEHITAWLQKNCSR